MVQLIVLVGFRGRKRGKARTLLFTPLAFSLEVVHIHPALQEAGAGFYQSTRTPDGVRATAASAFLEPNLGRPNLQLLSQELPVGSFDLGVDAIVTETETIRCAPGGSEPGVATSQT